MADMGKLYAYHIVKDTLGPGRRLILYLQGCHKKCTYCGQPEVIDPDSQDSRNISADQAMEYVHTLRSEGKMDRGITVTGGEPLLQTDFVLELFRRARAENLQTCLDTTGDMDLKTQDFRNRFDELMKYTDLVLVRIMNIGSGAETEYGEGNDITSQNTLEMLSYLDLTGKPVWIRYMLVPDNGEDEFSVEDVMSGSFLDKEDHTLDRPLRHTREFLDTLINVEKVVVVPFCGPGLSVWDSQPEGAAARHYGTSSIIRIAQARRILGAN